MNKKVINIVDDLATKENKSEMNKRYPIFEWIPIIPIVDQANSETENEELLYKRSEDDDDTAEYGEGEGQI